MERRLHRIVVDWIITPDRYTPLLEAAEQVLEGSGAIWQFFYCPLLTVSAKNVCVNLANIFRFVRWPFGANGCGTVLQTRKVSE